MADSLLRYYWSFERVLAPGLRYSQEFYEESLRELITPSTVWLDIGCGHQVLPEWRFNAENELVNLASFVAGIDVDSNSTAKHRTIKSIWMGDVQNLPFPDDSFTLITANMVVEHLANPQRMFTEIHRVLVPGGTFLFHTPNVNGYITAVNKYLPDRIKKLAAKVLNGRDPDDVYPTFYRCNTEESIIHAASVSGLEVERVLHIPSTATFVKILPIAAVELLWIRATMLQSLARCRTNIIGLLHKVPQQVE
jgi:ubiquinone/menaquinone biosynthesis C-methylase UbiE